MSHRLRLALLPVVLPDMAQAEAWIRVAKAKLTNVLGLLADE